MKFEKKRGRIKTRNKVKLFIVIVFTLVFIAYGCAYIEKIIKPSILSIAEIKAKAMVNQLVNESVRNEFSKDINADELLIIKSDEYGKISMVQSNTVMMNQMASHLAILIHDELSEMQPTKLKIPLGSALGNHILSQTGPMVELKILPIGTTKVNFKTEFESTGINQTRYRVFLQTETQAKVIVPFSTGSIMLSNVVPIVETVIVGDVPNSYVMVPGGDSIMDGMNIE